MTDFKAEMHQIRFRLGLRPRSSWGSLQHSPDPLAGFGHRFAAGGGVGLGKRREIGRGRGGRGSGGRETDGPRVTDEKGPLRDLLRHCVTSSQILMLPVKYCLFYVNYLLFGQLTFY